MRKHLAQCCQAAQAHRFHPLEDGSQHVLVHFHQVNIGQQLDSGFIMYLIFCIVYLHVKPLGGGRHEVASVSNAKQEAMEMRKQGMSTEAASDDKSGARGK